MTIPYQAPTRPLFGTSAEDYIDAVLGCVPGAADRLRIDAELRARLDPTVTLERAIATYGRPRDLAEFYLAAKPLESAPFFRRAIAALIDIPSVMVTGFLIFYLSWQLMGRGDQSLIASIMSGNPYAVILGFASLFVMSPVYYVVAESTFSRTVGKALLGLRVVRESGAKISVGQAIVRQIPLFFSFYLIDAAFALFTEKKQRAFELISRTRVVRA